MLEVDGGMQAPVWNGNNPTRVEQELSSNWASSQSVIMINYWFYQPLFVL